MLQQSKGIKVLALAAVVALAAGCASNSSVEKAQSTADEALRTAQEAKQSASSAQQTASAAKSAADAASAKADKSQACCNEVQSKLDRVFERSQRKRPRRGPLAGRSCGTGRARAYRAGLFFRRSAMGLR